MNVGDSEIVVSIMQQEGFVHLDYELLERVVVVADDEEQLVVGCAVEHVGDLSSRSTPRCF